MWRSVRRPVILCPVDGSAGARAAVAQAAALAKVRQAELHLLHVPRDRGEGRRARGGEQEVHPVIADAVQSTLDAVRGRGQHVPFRIKAQRGRPESAIPAYARRHRAGLIVTSAGYGGRRGLAGGSLARVLGRSAPCPVLVVPVTASGASRAVRASFRQVVCAVDFTKVSATALQAAAAFAAEGSGRMTLVHTVGEVARGMAFSGSEGAELAREQGRQNAAASRRLRRLVPHAVLKRYRVSAVVASGRPYRLIVEVASEIKADLIVMGLPRRSRVDEWLGGSTSRAVLRRAKSPVLLVPA